MSAVEAVLAQRLAQRLAYWETPGSWASMVGGRILVLADWGTEQFRDVADAAGSQSVKAVTTARTGAEHLMSRHRGLMAQVQVAIDAAHEVTWSQVSKLNDCDQRVVRVAVENLIIGLVVHWGLCETEHDMGRALTYPFAGITCTHAQTQAVA